MPSYSKNMQRIFEEYEAAGMPMPADLNDVADWAIETGKWKADRSLGRRKCAKDLAKALREEYITDDQGRRVRVKHMAIVKRGDIVLHLWADARRAGHDHMQASATQRRNQIVGDCKQLKTDVDWYNDFRPDREPIQLDLNFTNDIREIEALAAKRRLNASSSSARERQIAQSPSVEPRSTSPRVPSRASVHRDDPTKPQRGPSSLTLVSDQ